MTRSNYLFLLIITDNFQYTLHQRKKKMHSFSGGLYGFLFAVINVALLSYFLQILGGNGSIFSFELVPRVLFFHFLITFLLGTTFSACFFSVTSDCSIGIFVAATVILYAVALVMLVTGEAALFVVSAFAVLYVYSRVFGRDPSWLPMMLAALVYLVSTTFLLSDLDFVDPFLLSLPGIQGTWKKSEPPSGYLAGDGGLFSLPMVVSALMVVSVLVVFQYRPCLPDKLIINGQEHHKAYITKEEANKLKENGGSGEVVGLGGGGGELVRAYATPMKTRQERTDSFATDATGATEIVEYDGDGDDGYNTDDTGVTDIVGPFDENRAGGVGGEHEYDDYDRLQAIQQQYYQQQRRQDYYLQRNNTEYSPAKPVDTSVTDELFKDPNFRKLPKRLKDKLLEELDSDSSDEEDLPPSNNERIRRAGEKYRKKRGGGKK